MGLRLWLSLWQSGPRVSHGCPGTSQLVVVVGRQGRTPPIGHAFYARCFRDHDSLLIAMGRALPPFYRGGTGPSSDAGRWRCRVSLAPKSLHGRPLASCVERNLWLLFPPPELFLSRVQHFPEPGAPHPSPNSSLGAVSWLASPPQSPGRAWSWRGHKRNSTGHFDPRGQTRPQPPPAPPWSLEKG